MATIPGKDNKTFFLENGFPDRYLATYAKLNPPPTRYGRSIALPNVAIHKEGYG
jgi:hypothetical protein